MSPSGGAITGPNTPSSQYGYLSYRPGTTLGLAQAAALADVLCAELTARGAPSTPFIFSALALDVSRAKINRLIDAFLGTCVIGIGKEKEDREKRWREEVRDQVEVQLLQDRGARERVATLFYLRGCSSGT